MSNAELAKLKIFIRDTWQVWPERIANSQCMTLASMLASTPTEPGAPLSEEEKQETVAAFPVGFGPQWIIAIWRKIDDILAKRNVRKDAPKIDDDVIQLMLNAWFTFTPEEAGLEHQSTRMERVARVIVDAVVNYIECVYCGYTPTKEQLIAGIRAEIEAKGKPPEERVRTSPGGMWGFNVFEDEKLKAVFTSEKDAEEYRNIIVTQLQQAADRD